MDGMCFNSGIVSNIVLRPSTSERDKSSSKAFHTSDL